MPNLKSLKSVERRIRELQAEAARIREIEGIEKIRNIVGIYKLTPSQVKAALTSPSVSRKPKRRTSEVPKYLNPGNREQGWSGCGRRPRWFVAALGDGYRAEQLEAGRHVTSCENGSTTV